MLRWSKELGRIVQMTQNIAMHSIVCMPPLYNGFHD